MVASVFMHLSHEKKWIYGALLLTVVFFIVLLFVPLLTVSDDDRQRHQRAGVARSRSGPEHGTDMSLRAFHLLFIALSVVLAAFFAAWAVGQYRADHADWLRREPAPSRSPAAAAWRSTARRSSGRRGICR